MRSSDTVFVSPNYDIDDRLYFSDVCISKSDLMAEYESLIAEGHYDDALALIQDEDFYGAWLLNLLENRLHNLFLYIHGMSKPVFGAYQSEEPDTDQEGYIWVNEFDPSLNQAYPSSDTFPADDLYPE